MLSPPPRPAAERGQVSAARLLLLSPLSFKNIFVKAALSPFLLHKTKLQKKSRDLPAFCAHGSWWRIMVGLLPQWLLVEVVEWNIPGFKLFLPLDLWLQKVIWTTWDQNHSCKCPYSLCQKMLLSERRVVPTQRGCLCLVLNEATFLFCDAVTNFGWEDQGAYFRMRDKLTQIVLCSQGVSKFLAPQDWA